MTERTHISLWLEAMAKLIIEESILSCQDVTARFVGDSDDKTVVIVVERTPVRVPRGKLSVVHNGIWIHTNDDYAAALNEPLKFERASVYDERTSLVEPLFQFLQGELEGQTIVDLQMEGTDGDRNVCFETTLYSDDGELL
jgi:hypothetical protein